jgi:hypothetical protein
MSPCRDRSLSGTGTSHPERDAELHDTVFAEIRILSRRKILPGQATVVLYKAAKASLCSSRIGASGAHNSQFAADFAPICAAPGCLACRRGQARDLALSKRPSPQMNGLRRWQAQLCEIRAASGRAALRHGVGVGHSCSGSAGLHRARFGQCDRIGSHPPSHRRALGKGHFGCWSNCAAANRSTTCDNLAEPEQRPPVTHS